MCRALYGNTPEDDAIGRNAFYENHSPQYILASVETSFVDKQYPSYVMV